MTEIKMDEQVLVSVVVPVYNAEEYLEACINSLLKQTYQKLDILLVDDGSTDGSLFLCQKYEKLARGKVRVIHKENGGVSSARNLGILSAKGEYLIFVDADDQVHKELVEIFMEANDKSKTLLCGISDNEADLEKVYESEWRENISFYSKECFMELFFYDYINSPCNKLYDVKILRKYKIQYPEGVDLGEDLIFNLEYFKRAPSEYKVLTCPLYYYQDDHTGSLTNYFRPDLYEIQIKLFRILEEFLRSEQVWNEKNQKIYFGMFWDRLYLTVQLYLEHMKVCKEPSDLTILRTALNHDIWRKLESECVIKGQMNWKRILKKWHLFFLKKYLEWK